MRRSAVLRAILIAALNAWLCRDLFGLEYSVQMGSIEGSYMTIARWAMSNWHDLSWFPLWFDGQAFYGIYQPGFHLTVAFLASIGHLTPQHAFHLVAALAYCAVPVTLFILCFLFTRRLDFAFFSALLYSLVSPSCFFSPLTRSDLGNWLWPRRYQVLVHYGEGPHMAAVAMIPLTIPVLYGAVCLRKRLWIAMAPLAVAAVLITNWPGSVGLSLAIVAFCISRAGSPQRVHWPLLIGTGLVALMVVAPWIPPSTVVAVFANAQQSDAGSLGTQQIVPALLLTALLFLLHLLFSRLQADRTFRFLCNFSLITGTVALGREWFGWRLLPQATRFSVEFDLAFAGVAGWLLVQGLSRLPSRVRWVAIAVILIAAVPQAREARLYARYQTLPIDITSTIEYRMAKWFETNLKGERVFAPGSVALWMSLFTDVPQMAGCCDQGIPSFEHRLATYIVYTGDGAGPRDAEISLLWLRAYGAGAVGTTGPASTESLKPFRNWRKFDGVLPELWREGDNAIYRIPRKSPEPVRVIPAAALVSKPPLNGIDVTALEPFVKALEDPAAPDAHFRWLNRHEAAIDAEVRPGDVVYLQISGNSNWHAEQDGARIPARTDPLGMMYLQPAKTGRVQLRIVYGGGTEAAMARVLQGLGLLAIASVWLLRKPWRLA